MNLFDIWIGKVNLAVLVLVVSFVVVLPGQLLLCFKVCSRRLRLMPVIILFLAAAAELVMYLTVSGWKRLVFGFGAIYIVFMMLVCGLGWAVWLLVKKIGGPHDGKSDPDPAG